jgi:hypothetical protein
VGRLQLRSVTRSPSAVDRKTKNNQKLFKGTFDGKLPIASAPNDS